jgi:hypothetical protein
MLPWDDLPVRNLRATRVTVSLYLAGATVLLFLFLDHHVPVGEWVVLRYTRHWLLCAAFGVSCLSSGLRVLAAIDDHTDGISYLAERALLGAACGAFLFCVGVFVAGVLGVLGPVFFFLWPVALLASGGPVLRRWWQQAFRLYFANRTITAPRSKHAVGTYTTWSWVPKTGMVVLALALVYASVLAPENVGYDARWYHLPIAEQYASSGRIAPFREGWFLGAYPQFASLIYAWAFCSPFGDLSDHVALAKHLEWLFFLGTLFGVTCVSRRLSGKARAFAAGALFLFPGLFVYDSSLIVGADHILAFWACPLAIALYIYFRRPGLSSAILLAIVAAGATLTKYQAIYLLLPVTSVFLILAARSRDWRGIPAYGAAILALTSPHWLKNWIYYGDPLFPLAGSYMRPGSFTPAVARGIETIYQVPEFAPTGLWSERLWSTLKHVFALPFTIDDFWDIHGGLPVFGFTFTVLGPLTLILPGCRRARIGVVMTWAAVAIWYLTNHQERFLQAVAPWMAAVVAAVVTRIWTLGTPQRFVLIAVLSVQVTWALGLVFLRNHRMASDGSPFFGLIRHLSLRGDETTPPPWDSDLARISRDLPPDAVVLMHDQRLRFGLSRTVVTDAQGFQSAIDYVDLGAPATVARRLGTLGVTHVIWRANVDGRQTKTELGQHVGFVMFAASGLATPRSIGPYRLSSMQTQTGDIGEALLVTCRAGEPATGYYRPHEIEAGKPHRTYSYDLRKDIDPPRLIVVDRSCSLSQNIRTLLTEHFTPLMKVAPYEFLLRKK